MGTTTLLIIAVICLMSFSAMTGLIGGYFLFAGKFSPDGSIVDDLMATVSSPPGLSTADIASQDLVQSQAPVSADPAMAPTLAPPSPVAANASASVLKVSQGDLSLDDFFTDFSVDAVNMSGDLPLMGESAANRQSGTGDLGSGRPKTESVDDGQVLSEVSPEGA